MRNKLITLLGIALPLPALAYLDPGTGSMLLQVILGGIAAVAVAIKLFWYRILAMFGLNMTPPEAEDGEADSAGSDSDAKDKQNTGGGGGWD